MTEEILKDKNDLVNNPEHYFGKYGLQSIDVIRNFADGLSGIQGFY